MWCATTCGEKCHSTQDRKPEGRHLTEVLTSMLFGQIPLAPMTSGRHHRPARARPAGFSDVTGALTLAVAIAIVYLCTHYAFVFWTVAALAGGSALLGCVPRGSCSPRLAPRCPERGP